MVTEGNTGSRSSRADHFDDPSAPILDRDGRPLSTFDLKVYRRAGLSRSEAAEWAAAGVRPYQAEGFRVAGIDLAEATRLTELGVPGGFAARALDAGDDPVAAWQEEAARSADRLAAEAATVARRRDEAEAAQALHMSKRKSAIEKLRQLVASDLVTVGDIADLANVHSGVASRWVGEPGFPSPEVAGRSPVFRLEAVLDFLSRPLGSRPPRLQPQALTVEWMWNRISRVSLDDDSGSGELAATIVALAVHLREHDHGTTRLSAVLEGDPESVAERLTEAARPLRDVAGFGELVDDLARTVPRIAAVPLSFVRGLDLAIDLDLAPAFLLDSILDAHHGSGRNTSPVRTNHVVAQIVAELADPEDGDTIYDPAVGQGEVLLWCARSRRDGTVIGRDADAAAARVSRVRFYLRRMPVVIEVGDSFEAAPVEANLAVLDPELATNRRKIAAWISLATGDRDGGPRRRCAMTLPRAAFVPDSGGVSPIDLHRDYVEAVVLMPPRVKPGNREWVAAVRFASDANAERDVVVVDLRNVDLASAERLGTPSRRRVPVSRSLDQLARSAPRSGRDWLAIPEDAMRLIRRPGTVIETSPNVSVCRPVELVDHLAKPLVDPELEAVKRLAAQLLDRMSKAGLDAASDVVRQALSQHGLAP